MLSWKIMSRFNFRTNSIFPSFSQTLGYLKPTVEDKATTWLWLNCARASFHLKRRCSLQSRTQFDCRFLFVKLFRFLSVGISHIFPKLICLTFCGDNSFFYVTAYPQQHFVKLSFVLFISLFAYSITFPRILFDFAFKKIIQPSLAFPPLYCDSCR